MAENGESGLIQAFQALKIIPNAGTIRTEVRALQKRYPKGKPGALAQRLATGAIWRMTGAGVVASLPGAIPGLGTAAQIAIEAGTLSSETWLLLRNLATLQMSVAALYGHDTSAPERQEELMIIWGLTTGAIVPAKGAATRVGTKIAVSQFNRRVSGKLLQSINRRIGTTVFTKWGTKRGGIALGRLIPFGVGALVGGGMNYATMKVFSKQLLRFYGEILLGDEDLIVVDA